jgi:hypothetical protein
MKITAVDSTRRIFQIDNILPANLVDKINSIDWENVEWTRQPYQETWPRRLLTPAHPVVTEVNTFINTTITEIGDACGVVLNYASTSWWLDEPGFTVNIHTDGHLPASMQLFWITPSEYHATVFYNSKNSADIRFAPKSIPNTGYIMLNLPNTDGSQPLHWHGMLNSVPAGTVRLCSYTTFGAYENK